MSKGEQKDMTYGPDLNTEPQEAVKSAAHVLFIPMREWRSEAC